MQNPLIWLGLSLLLLAICLGAALLVALPVMQELARAARSAEKLLDMLSRELPPTLQSLRATGEEIAQLSDHVNEGVRSAGQVVKQVDEGLETVRHQAEAASRNSLSLVAGLRQAWQVFWQPIPVQPLAEPTAAETALAQGTQLQPFQAGEPLAEPTLPPVEPTGHQEPLAALEEERRRTQQDLEQLLSPVPGQPQDRA